MVRKRQATCKQLTVHGLPKENNVDINLHYEETGAGKPLILLHGNGENCTYFKHQLAYFSGIRRVIAVDTRGHGRSPRGTAPFTIRQFADDLASFMDGLHVKRADILGFSDGGNTALVFAAKYPERVNKLIVNGANLYPAGMKAHIVLPIVIEHRLTSLLASISKRAKARAELLALMVNDPNLTPDNLAAIQVPTLVIAGTHDMIRESHTRLIAQSIPHAMLSIVKGDHFIAAKNPSAFNAEVERFLLG